MLYEPYETDISRKILMSITDALKQPPCLLGGWAVFRIVNQSFRESKGRDYLGSRDIDIGFHLDPNASPEHLKKSDFAAAIATLESTDFELVGYRLVKHFEIDTHKELTIEEAKRKPSHEMFDVYVDPIVDILPANAKLAFGFIPIDEPILAHVFAGKGGQSVEIFGRTVQLPMPYLLLATKLRSVLNRDKVHKRIKDLADIYAVAWHSGVNLRTLRGQIDPIVDQDERKSILSKLTISDINQAALATGVDSREIRSVLDELAR